MFSPFPIKSSMYFQRNCINNIKTEIQKEDINAGKNDIIINLSILNMDVSAEQVITDEHPGGFYLVTLTQQTAGPSGETLIKGNPKVMFIASYSNKVFIGAKT